MNAIASIPKEIIDMLREIAEETCRTYDDVTMDMHGQDGFDWGERAGRVELARELCDALSISFTMPKDDSEENDE